MLRDSSAATIMVMGTSSSAGKSLLVAGLCRCFARRGIRVAPFKSQNMSNNAAVCRDGSEIGRSQALQALAAGVEPRADFNPILLKPEGNTRSQVIVNGRATTTLAAAEYFHRRDQLWPVATAAIDRLRREFELVVIEGAGSPAELNLADAEIVNFAVARHCQSAVLLVGDIERGGVFAQLLGTLWLLSPEDRALVSGLIVNKFRGDLSLFDSGVKILEQRSDVPVLGVLPWIDELHLPEEDALAIHALTATLGDSVPSACAAVLKIVVVHLPHISNFDDFDPLENHAGVSVCYAKSVESLENADVVILPGTKNTIEDLHWLRKSGIADAVVRIAQRGKHIVGICGGYQMLGRQIENPSCLESTDRQAVGLGLLDVNTIFHDAKQTRQVRVKVVDDAVASGTKGQILTGYEIHHGRTRTSSPWLTRIQTDVTEDDAMDGAHSADGRVWGCYLHGLFHNDQFRVAWLQSLGVSTVPELARTAHAVVNDSLNRLADVLETHLGLDRLLQQVGFTDRKAQHVIAR